MQKVAKQRRGQNKTCKYDIRATSYLHPLWIQILPEKGQSNIAKNPSEGMAESIRIPDPVLPKIYLVISGRL